MKKILTILLILLFSNVASAQVARIYMNNGADVRTTATTNNGVVISQYSSNAYFSTGIIAFPATATKPAVSFYVTRSFGIMFGYLPPTTYYTVVIHTPPTAQVYHNNTLGSWGNFYPYTTSSNTFSGEGEAYLYCASNNTYLDFRFAVKDINF